MPSPMPTMSSPAGGTGTRQLLGASLMLLALGPATAAATEVAVPRLVGDGVDQKQLADLPPGISITPINSNIKSNSKEMLAVQPASCF